jgi:tubulin polyglutamylase complex subunit 2
MDTQKTLFNNACLSIITYLETFDECSNIEFTGTVRATSRDLDAWEKNNLPYKLPDDMKAFYQLFDGFKLTYGIEVSSTLVPVGTLFLNKLSEVVRVPMEGTFPASLGGTGSTTSAGFALDNKAGVGNIVLLFRSHEEDAATCAPAAAPNYDTSAGVGTEESAVSSADLPLSSVVGSRTTSYENPEIWFQDVSARWHYISGSFSDYLRLLVMHCGVHGWQLAYTPEGIPPLTQQWMHLFCRERLTMDLNSKD